MLNSRWFLEQTTADEGSFHSLKEIIYSGSSDYQSIEVIRTGSYGKCFVLDGKIQCTEVDEFIYHEAIVHPAMVLHGRTKRVLIAGGGEGAAAREVLKHPSVSEVVIVDLDKDVVDISKKFLSELNEGVFEDKRVKILFEDARMFIEKSGDFDIIIADLPEPTECGPALMLYTKEFYQDVYRSLNENGVFVTQAASAAVNNLSFFTACLNTIRQVFPVVRPYVVNIPSFYSPWGFVLASKEKDPLNLSLDYINEAIDKLNSELRFYDAETHSGLFSLPKYIRESIKREELIIKDSSPISFY